MKREADTANRVVEEMNYERQYRRHLKTLAALKPSVDTHYNVPSKFRKDKAQGHKVRIFDGKKAAKRAERDVDEILEKKKHTELNIFSARPTETKFRIDIKAEEPTRPKTQEKKQPQTARPATKSRLPRPKTKNDDVIRRKERTRDSSQCASARPKTARSETKQKPKEKKVVAEPPKPVEVAPKAGEYIVTYGLDMWDTSDEYSEDESPLHEVLDESATDHHDTSRFSDDGGCFELDEDDFENDF